LEMFAGTFLDDSTTSNRVQNASLCLQGDRGHVSEDEPVAPRQALFVSEDLDLPSYQAVYDASVAVDVGALHDDGVLDLGVHDGGVVSDARVGADVGVGADLAVVAYDGGPLIVVRLWTIDPSPIATLFVIVACPTIVP